MRKGDVIARLADLSSYRVDATVSDVHAGKLHAGMAAVVLHRRAAMAAHRRRRLPDGRERRREVHAWRSPSRPAPGCAPACGSTSRSITDRKARALRVTRGPFADDSSRRAFVVRGDRAVRVPLVLGLAGVDTVEVVSGAAEGDELIVSDMRDYLHLAEIVLK